VKTTRGFLCIFLVLLFLVAACTSRTGGSIEDKGNTIELKAQNHTVKALKMKPMDGTFVLFTANVVPYPESLTYLDGRIIVMPKEEADKLKAQYGNFVDTENKGHELARKSVRYFSLIAMDRPTQKQIKKLIDLNSHKRYPLIKLSMTELRVTELLYKKSKVYLSGDVGKQYVVSKIEILEENHPL
jgi:hypothetical protein